MKRIDKIIKTFLLLEINFCIIDTGKLLIALTCCKKCIKKSLNEMQKNGFIKFCGKNYRKQLNQGRKTKFAFPLYTVETETKFRLRFHCIQGKRKFRFSSLN
jgi:hypothetical protein